jgi:hypothetical protein
LGKEIAEVAIGSSRGGQDKIIDRVLSGARVGQALHFPKETLGEVVAIAIVEVKPEGREKICW